MVTKQIDLDIWNKSNVVVYANTGEIDSRYIEVSFKDENQNNIILLNRNVTFYAEKPDGTTIFNNCTVDTTNNTATIELTSQTLSVPGILECEFQIFEENNVLMKVSGLKIFVSSSKDFSQAIESTSEYNALTSLICDIEANTEKIGNLNNLTTNKKTNLVSAINELNIKILSPYSLYFNSSGTKSTITLSDNAVNYDYIEIYYQKDAGNMLHTKIYDPNGKLLTLNSVTYYSNTLFLRSAVVNINGKSVTWKSNDSGNGSITGSNCSVDSSQVFSIVKIIGYK